MCTAIRHLPWYIAPSGNGSDCCHVHHGTSTAASQHAVLSNQQTSGSTIFRRFRGEPTPLHCAACSPDSARCPVDVQWTASDTEHRPVEPLHVRYGAVLGNPSALHGLLSRRLHHELHLPTRRVRIHVCRRCACCVHAGTVGVLLLRGQQRTCQSRAPNSNPNLTPLTECDRVLSAASKPVQR